jgi:nucleotide-binding universal stress UspA family protein
MSEQQILVPTDLSDCSEAALQYGAMLRDRLNAALTILFADEPGYPMNMPELPLAVKERPADEKKKVLALVRGQIEKFIPAPLPEIRTTFGPAAEVIVRTAEEIDASLIVMGTRGRSGLKRLMLGSVTESVLSETMRAVVTLGPSVKDPAKPIRTILCPVNFSFVALDALRRAAQIANDGDADLIVLYVAEEKDPPMSEKLEEELAAWIEPHLRDQTRYRHMVATGNAAERVLAIADETGTDLLVMGAQKKMFGESTVIGGTSERVVRFARCAVLTVPRASV